MRNLLRRWLEGGTATPHASAPVPAGDSPGKLLSLQGEDKKRQTGAVAVRPGAIDLSSLNNILALQRAGAPNILDRVIALYITDSPSHIDGMRTAVATGDTDRLWQAAHSFKSSSTNLGALNLAEMCRSMETLGRGRLLAGADELLVEIETEYSAACEALAAIQKGADL
jgi:HPt (histidine-containing phosphotransfer) domain-containing protein